MLMTLSVKRKACQSLSQCSSQIGKAYFRRLHSAPRQTITSSTESAHETTESHMRVDPHRLTTRLAVELGLPLFRASGSQLSLLEDPSRFYDTLKSKISTAKFRIVLASLYIGKEEDDLIASLHSALSNNHQLRVTILVDALRSTREASPSPSCASLIARLHRDFPGQVQLRLYRTPKLKPWLEKFVGKRFNEGWGLQHMKIYGFDDDVVISGANLSRDYFTNRRDRYLLIEQHKEICDYLHALVQTVCQFSYRLDADEARTFSPTIRQKETETTAWRTVWDGDSRLGIAENRAESRRYPKEDWSEAASRSVQDFTESWRGKTISSPHEGGGDTLLLPLLQMGPLSIRQETKAIPQLFSMAQSVSATSVAPVLVNLTSGYFSLYKPYKTLLSKANATRNAIFKIICAAPEANGFFKSKGVSGWIPEAYTWFEYQFWSILQKQGQLLHQGGAGESEGGIELKEWKKDGWTYHAKGIWYTPPGETHKTGSDGKFEASGPSMVHVGSSNYGSRSSDLDLECTFLISTSSATLSQALLREIRSLQKDASDIVDESLFKRPERNVRKRVKLAAWFLSGML